VFDMMTRRPSYFVAVLLLLAAMAPMGCGKKVAPAPVAAKVEAPAPPESAPASPTIALRAVPEAVEKGQRASLTWESTNATTVTIDGVIGSRETSGTADVQPGVSTTYRATATGPGGSAVAEARITVLELAPTPAPPPSLSDREFFSKRIGDIYFGYDQYDIREDARNVLIKNAAALAERPGIRITIEGHCDERGSEKFNLALGDRRATAVKSFLVAQGISEDRIDTTSYGKEKPVCGEHNETCWQQNRRAHHVIR
jgi:peptidoglycan-associated lipoprotein